MKKNNISKKFSINPQNLVRAIILCLFIDGIVFSASFLLFLLNITFGFLPDIIFLLSVMIVAEKLDKNELRRIFVWREMPVFIFAAIMVMFFGLVIIKSEILNFFEVLVPIPKGFFSDWFHVPEGFFLTIISIAIFPGFTEEVLYRGIIARRFFSTYSPRKAILLSSLIFAVVHMNPWQIVNAFIGGIFFGWIYLRYRSIWLCIFIHIYHNILVSYVKFPHVRVENSAYLEIWRHPLWLDILGIFLFLFGLFTLILTGKKNKVVAKAEVVE